MRKARRKTSTKEKIVENIQEIRNWGKSFNQEKLANSTLHRNQFIIIFLYDLQTTNPQSSHSILNIDIGISTQENKKDEEESHNSRTKIKKRKKAILDA
ncbi:unnamed protein product [Vicia faba]|uniref:Uncharacterized protein n=1 Tax=Vicia faba TaxID=3906 RepID=A0AAV0Z7B6_VICFA|nr:unnamed protein product [Vicia faba]